MKRAAHGWLYDWALLPVGSAPPFPGPEAGPLVGSVVCQTDPPSCAEMARIWIVPNGELGAVPRRIADELLAALEHGMPIAILGHDVRSTRAAAVALLALAGDS